MLSWRTAIAARCRRTRRSNGWLDPAATAVLEIDMHRGHVGPEEELSLPVPRARARVDEHNAFQAAARELGVPVIHVQHWQRHGGIDDAPHRPTTEGQTGGCCTSCTCRRTR